AAAEEAARLAAEKAEQERLAAEKAEAERLAAERAAARSITENVYFLLDRTNIRKSEQAKIDHIIAVMNEYPEAVVVIGGHADKETGTAKHNMKLSEGRANNVAKALKAAGIAEDRITVEYYGDTQRVSDVREENRVSVCVTK
ncbi:MAG: OmpA family protein, partial [Bacteroidales bacterium]|nr:OmpA family protein [Bacteroidales bacterium]